MSDIQVDSGRRGGRAARRALRAAPLAQNQRPVWPGMEGGRYKPLKDEDIQKIHQAALRRAGEDRPRRCHPVLHRGLTRGRRRLQRQGAADSSRARWSRTPSPRRRGSFVLHGQEPQPRHGALGQEGLFRHRRRGRAYRRSHDRRVSRSRWLQDALRHRPHRRRDGAYPFLSSAPSCRATCPIPRRWTSTPAMPASWAPPSMSARAGWQPEHLEASFQMLHAIAGGEDKWRARPFVSQSNCFVVPPLKFATDACRCLETGGARRHARAAALGRPGRRHGAGGAGRRHRAGDGGGAGRPRLCQRASSRARPAIFGTWPFVSDLRTGAMSGGSPEQALLSAACGQMAHFYDLTGGTSSGMCDSKVPDAQAGCREGLQPRHRRQCRRQPDLRNAPACMPACWAICLESLVIDNDIIGADPAHHQGHRGQRRHALARDHPRRLHRRAGTLSGLGPDAAADADATMSIRRSATARARRNGASRAPPTSSTRR